MITCIAIDDEPMALEVIQRYCSQSKLITLKSVFRQPLQAIEYLGREKTDLIFLDINMPDLSGIQLLQSLSQKPLVIFTTAYSHYAVESYTLDAVDYLLKPITLERFLAAVNKAVRTLSPERDPSARAEAATIFVKSGSQTHQLNCNEILYLEKKGNYLTIHLKDRQILLRENMNEVFDLVPATDFIRVHKSYVVAIRHIAMIEIHQLTIQGKKIPVGSTYRDALRRRLEID